MSKVKKTPAPIKSKALRPPEPPPRPEVQYTRPIDAWRAIAEGDAPGGFVFEDDFEAEDTLASVLDALSEDGGRDWDMVKLFTFDPDAKLVSERPLSGAIRLAVPFRVPTCLIGYGLTQEAPPEIVDAHIMIGAFVFRIKPECFLICSL